MAHKGILTSSERDWNMTDEQTPQQEPGAEGFPAFLCPACGYVCATTWEAKWAREWPERALAWKAWQAQWEASDE